MRATGPKSPGDLASIYQDFPGWRSAVTPRRMLRAGQQQMLVSGRAP